MTTPTQNQRSIAHEQMWAAATAVRDACYAAAVAAYEDAKMDGLCDDGAYECALSAMQSLDFKAIMVGAVLRK